MFKIFFRSLYLLQLENYNLSRFLTVVFRKPFRSQKPRQPIVWTPKLAAVFFLALAIQVGTAYFLARPLARSDAYLGLFPAVFLFTFVLFFYINFIFLAAAALILRPADLFIKNIIIRRAKAKLAQFPKLKIIGITGSFGKTTMKEVLAAVLAERFKVLKTPDSVNTPVGISRLILKHLNGSVEVFIVEMGAYQRGDIKALCQIAPPDIAVLTGINEAHLERFGSIENTIRAKFEIVENAREMALVVLNAENELVKDNYQKYAGSKPVVFYDSFSGMPVTVPILGQYIWGVVKACVIIAEKLGMSEEEINRGIAKIRPVPHRLERIETSNGITVIDDSYNGNPDGVREAVNVLATFQGRRKIYLTPGLVEAGQRAREVHNRIGEELNPVADLVILIKNSVTPFIAEKLDPKKVIWFDSATEAHAALPNILKTGDVILFQNDWPDNYL